MTDKNTPEQEHPEEDTPIFTQLSKEFAAREALTRFYGQESADG